jgi:hypothetical protein
MISDIVCLQDVVVHHSQLATQPLDDSIELEAIPTQPAVCFRDFRFPHQLSKTNLCQCSGSVDLWITDPEKISFLASFLL